ncbi:hypothetical protein [Brachybacterium sp. AOP35-5H-19]|uniref:hypothetical protein n=1 Tax=Brachybacterium sp. AOP35-5H-19 TaxID=3457685 RepID=UPI004034C9A4
MTIIPLHRPAPAADHLDRLPALWNTSADNTAVRARQQRAEELTRFQIDHDPTYAAELAQLRSWVGSYEIPTPEEDA